MRRFATVAGVLAVAVAVWLAVFFGGAYALVRLTEAHEGDISECNVGQCGMWGEFLDNHDLLATLLLAVLAALPGCALIWWRFANRNAKPS
jgi:hypothetical protein